MLWKAVSLIYYIFMLLLFLFRKGLFWVSLIQLVVHTSALLRFIWARAATPNNNKTTSHSESTPRSFHYAHHSDLLQVAASDTSGSRNKRSQVAASDTSGSRNKRSQAAASDTSGLRTKRSHRTSKKRRDDLYSANSTRKVSTTLMRPAHHTNYLSAKGFWSNQLGGEYANASSDTDLEKTTRGYHSESRYEDVFEDTEDGLLEALPSRAEAHSATQESFVLIGGGEESESHSSDQEFISAFKDTESEEEAAIVYTKLSLQKSFSDFSGTGSDFMTFSRSGDFMEVLGTFAEILKRVDLEPGPINQFFPKIRFFLKSEVPRFEDVLDRLELKRNQPEYSRGLAAQGKKVVVVGAGPCGLRMAIEAQLLGAETTVYESRPYMDRNNVLKLWTFVMEDLKSLGAKKFYPNLGNGCLNTISIKILQLTLLKICLILGVRFKPAQTFLSISEPTITKPWTVVSERREEVATAHRQGGRVPAHKEERGEVTIHQEEEHCHAVIAATGRKVFLEGFERLSLDAPMAIAITANFQNFHTMEEKFCKEIPGLSKQYDRPFFKKMEKETGIKLENIVYYQDSTHYFVMTAKKESLLRKGVLRKDCGEREGLLRPENIHRKNLEDYAREAAEFSTRHFSHQLPKTPFATWKGKPDVSIFDFTNLYRSQNASRIMERKGAQIMTAIVGDSLIEPFWPEGTGIGQGFLSVLDTAWMLKRYFHGEDRLSVIREREKLYSLLRQTSQQRLKPAADNKWSIDPRTRYLTTTFPFHAENLEQLFDTDSPDRRRRADSPDEIDDGGIAASQEEGKGQDTYRRKERRSRDKYKHRETLFLAD